MNERVQEIALQAGAVNVWEWASDDVLDTKNMDAEKFAELIVRECMNIVSNQTTLDTNEDFREGFNHGLKYAWTDIRKHFGVE
jgi:hypothetical protein